VLVVLVLVLVAAGRLPQKHLVLVAAGRLLSRRHMSLSTRHM
jgi:hypothetical protein